MVYSEKEWITWMDQLAENDYLIQDDFISDDLYRKIMTFFSDVEEKDKLKKAGIGSSKNYKIEESIRGDFIYWLDRDRDRELDPFFELMDELIAQLKRYCFLSLSGSEFHIAKYPAGSYYDRHIDRPNERSNREITVLIYLNKDWQKGNGGELKMYRDEGELLIEPISKRLLLFKSDKIEHEVLKTNVERYSLTGWLLHQPSSLGYIFPR